MDFNNDSGTLANVAVISPQATTVTFVGTGGIVPFSGQTSERPSSPSVGTWRFNSTLNKTEYWNGTTWQPDVTRLSESNDVVITSPVSGNVLQYNGSNWVNSGASTPSSAAGILSVWTALGGNRYYADFVHGLGTTNVVVGLFDNNTNTIIQPDSIVLTNSNTTRVTVVGNSRSLRIVVIANGLYVGGAGVLVGQYANLPTPGTVDRLYLAYDTKVLYRDNGTSWDIMTASSGAVKTMSYFATSLDSPNTSDFAVNALAPVISDPANTALNVRSFSNTIEQGIAITVPIPTGANNITFNIRGRSLTAPSGTAVVQHRAYIRKIPNNAAIGSWSGTTFTNFTVPLNNYFQMISQTFSLSTLGLTVGDTFQIELTRTTGVANNLAYPWLLAELTIVFS